MTSATTWASLAGSLRQWFYPREFRIPRYAVSAGLRKELADLMALLPRLPGEVDGPQTTDSAARLHFLADVGTGIWRLRRRMCQPGTERPREEFRREFTHLQSVWDALLQNGFRIQEHTDRKFDTGQSLKVAAFQPTPGLTYEKVIDTIKPTIYFQDQLIQLGEVIVGTPPGDSPQRAEGSPPVKPLPPNPRGN